MKRFLTFALSAFLAVSVGHQSRANDLWTGIQGASTDLAPGKIYLTVGGGAAVYHLPKFRIFQRTNFPLTQVFGRIEHDVDVTAFGAGGSIGYVFKDGVFPTWVGRLVRISFVGSYWRGNATSDERFEDGSGNQGVTVYSVSGTDNLGINSFGTFGDRSRLKTRYSAFELALRLASEIPLSERLILTPSVGVFGGRSVEDYRLTYGLIIVNNLDRVGDVTEKNRSWRFGADIGATLTWIIWPDLTLTFGGRAGVVYVRTRLRASDCFNQVGMPPGSVCFDNGTGFATSVTNTDSTVGFRGVAFAGVHYTLVGGVLVSLVGFASVDTAVPRVNNPSTGLALPTTAGPATVGHSTGYAYGGMVTLRIPFDFPN